MGYGSKLAGILRHVPKIELTEACAEAEAIMFRNPDAGCIAVVDRFGRPAGLLVYSRFFHLLTASRNMGYLLRQPVGSMMSRSPVMADVDEDPADVLVKVNKRHAALRRDPVLMMDGEKIAGVVQVSDLALLQPQPAPPEDAEVRLTR